MRRWVAAVAGLLLVGPAASGCSADFWSHSARTASPPPATTTAAPTSTPSPYVLLPDDTATTAPGTVLQLGQPATVGWLAPHDTTGVLGITVTSMRETTFAQSFVGWQQPKQLLATTPYFVEASIKNGGHSDLAGLKVPLYGLDAAGQLVQASTFAQDFKPCEPNSFPEKRFGPGDTTKVCLVYLVPHQGRRPGRLTGVVYRPDESLAPITWKGHVEPPKPAPATASSSAPPKKR